VKNRGKIMGNTVRMNYTNYADHVYYADLRKSYTSRGALAKKNGASIDDNPHPRGCLQWDYWRAGYQK